MIILSPKAQEAFDAVLKKLETGDLSPVVDIVRLSWPADSPIPAATWSFSNRLISYLMTGDLDCRGAEQWKQLGRFPKKGSKAGFILVPMIKGIKKSSPDGEDDVIVNFKSVPIFGFSSTEGAGLATEVIVFDPPTLPPMYDVAKAWGIDVTFGPKEIDPSAYGYFVNETITMMTHDAHVFLHEMAHAAHARIADLSKLSKLEKEVVAEFIATVLTSLYGLGDRSGNAARYIRFYAEEQGYTPAAVVRKFASTIGSVLSILETAAQELQPVLVLNDSKETTCL